MGTSGTTVLSLRWALFRFSLLFGWLSTIDCRKTWEDPAALHPETKAKGDNDPLDVCEIGEQVGYVGQVKQVKVLGIMALLDEGETDWKVIVVDVHDPLASKLNDIEDVERHLPGLIRATNEWFRYVLYSST
jgi:inorganic pyrophosphatase